MHECVKGLKHKYHGVWEFINFRFIFSRYDRILKLFFKQLSNSKFLLGQNRFTSYSINLIVPCNKYALKCPNKLTNSCSLTEILEFFKARLYVPIIILFIFREFNRIFSTFTLRDALEIGVLDSDQEWEVNSYRKN